MEIGSHINFDFFIRFITGMQQFLGNGCEIVIHDFRKGYDHSIVHIINGELSGRDVGDSPIGAMIVQEGRDIGPYADSQILFYNGKKGQLVKSCTTLICDEKRKIIGSVCLNLEVSDLLLAQQAIQSIVQYGSDGGGGQQDGLATGNIDDVLRYHINQSEQLVGKPMSLMSREEKVRALGYLDSMGVFKISKANVLLCQAFQVSKYTLYNYLEEARAQQEPGE